MRNIYLSIIGFLVLSLTPFYGQSIEESSEVKGFLDSAFEHIDKTKVPTGLLLDYAVELIDLDDFKGENLDSVAFADATSLDFILRTIRSSALLTKPYANVDQLIKELPQSDNVPMVVAIYEYSFIKESAIEDGLISVVNDKAYDVYSSSGNWLDPYEQNKVFAFAPLKSASGQGTVSFDFDSIFTNVSVSNLEFNPGDGRGYRSILQGGIIDVPYNAPGLYDLCLKATLSDGSVMWAKSNIYVAEGVRSEMTNYVDYSYAPQILVDGEFVRAYVSVKYKTGGTNLTRPFIIAEGFDPVSLMGIFGLETNGYGLNSFDDMYDSIPEEMKNLYDFIYVDWRDCEKDIFANAHLFKNIIHWVNSMKSSSGSTEKNIVLGQSMGGLIARIALRQMEVDDEEHDTKMYISHDAPHLGANIPVSVLYGLNDMYDYWKMKFDQTPIMNEIDNKYGIYGYVNAIYTTLHSTAAKQMLYNYVNLSGQIDNSIHEDFVEELNDLGFPQGYEGCEIKNVAIANSGHGNISYSETDALVSYNRQWSSIDAYFAYQILGLGYLKGVTSLGWKLCLNANVNIKPTIRPNSNISSINLTYSKRLFGQNVQFVIFSREHNSGNETYLYDTYPGSQFKVPLLSGVQNILPELDYDKQFMFIPTASALCVKNGENLSPSDYIRDYYWDYPSYPNETPFIAVKTASIMKGHLFGEDVYDDYTWIYSLIDKEISGPAAPVSGDRYVIINGEYLNTEWSTSDATIATINSNGIITVKSSGFVTIFAEVRQGGSILKFEKRVMIGFPTFTLSKRDMTLVGASYSGWRIQASHNSSEFADFIKSTNVKYHWGVKYSGTSDIIWTETDSREFWFDFKNHTSSTNANVYFRVSNDGGISSTYSIFVLNLIPDSPIFIIDGTGNLLALPGDSDNSVETKGIDSTIISIEDTDVVIEFDSRPTLDELTASLIDNYNFKMLVKEMKPWGEKELMVEKMIMIDSEGTVMWAVPLTIIFNPQINNQL